MLNGRINPQVPNETFKAAAHLVVAGKKRRWPDVKIILAHLGGSTPFLAPRIAVLSKYIGCPLSHDEIMEDFKTFYFDLSLSSHETTLTAMRAFVDDSRLLFGTDFPGASWARLYIRQCLTSPSSCKHRNGPMVHQKCGRVLCRRPG